MEGFFLSFLSLSVSVSVSLSLCLSFFLSLSFFSSFLLSFFPTFILLFLSFLHHVPLDAWFRIILFSVLCACFIVRYNEYLVCLPCTVHVRKRKIK